MTIGAIISAAFGSLVNATLGYSIGSYGTGIALIYFGKIPLSLSAETNTNVLYFAVIPLSIYAGLLAGRLSMGIINFGFTVSKINLTFDSISPDLPHDLSEEIQKIGKITYKNEWFDDRKPSHPCISVSIKDFTIFESCNERGGCGTTFNGTCEFSFGIELRNDLYPLFLQLNKIVNHQKPISRVPIKLLAEDIQQNDFIYRDGKYCVVKSKNISDEKIEIKVKDLSSQETFFKVDKNQSILAHIKSPSELMDNFVNPFSNIISDVNVKSNFSEKTVHLVILTYEITTTKKYVSPYSIQRSNEIHQALITGLKGFKNIKPEGITGEGPIRIYKKYEAQYLKDIDFGTVNFTNDQLDLINSIPPINFAGSFFDELRKTIIMKVFFAAIGAVVSVTIGMGIEKIIDLIT